MTATTSTHAAQGRDIPSLDGLRAVSIGLVLLSHVAGTTGSPVPLSIHRWLNWGALGVHVFFVISGFLITRLLLAEWDRRGTIGLGAFYFRRTLRIFPPFYVYLGVVALLVAMDVLDVPRESLLRGGTYTANYGSGGSWYTGHAWSLAVEEQFYLLWPAALLAAGRRRAWVVALLVVVLCPLIRVAEYHLLGTTHGIGTRFETIADALATGCLLAYAGDWLASRPEYAAFRASAFRWLLPLVVLGASALDDHPYVSLLAGRSVANVGIAAMLLILVHSPDGAVGQLLNAAPLAWLGRISYSLYLWQQLFLARGSPAAPQTFPINLALALSAAVASYYLVERPSLRLRRWLTEWWRARQSGALEYGEP